MFKKPLSNHCSLLSSTFVLFWGCGGLGFDAARADVKAPVDAAHSHAESSLLVAARSLNVKVAKELLDQGADPNAQDRDGLTPLHLAAYFGSDKETAARKDLTRLLIAKGANVQQGDAQGKTVMHIAAMKGRVEMLDDLLSAKASINAADSLGRTPLHDAAMYGQMQFVKRLLDLGASPAAADQEGNTPLHLAVNRMRAETVAQLLDAGAAINATNKKGQTPLHVLAMENADEPEIENRLPALAVLLISKGARVNAVDGDGHTPLHYALQRNHVELTGALRVRGATDQ